MPSYQQNPTNASNNSGSYSGYVSPYNPPQNQSQSTMPNNQSQNTNSDNLLDNPSEVQKILSDGAANPVQFPNIQTSQTQNTDLPKVNQQNTPQNSNEDFIQLSNLSQLGNTSPVQTSIPSAAIPNPSTTRPSDLVLNNTTNNQNVNTPLTPQNPTTLQQEINNNIPQQPSLQEQPEPLVNPEHYKKPEENTVLEPLNNSKQENSNPEFSQNGMNQTKDPNLSQGNLSLGNVAILDKKIEGPISLESEKPNNQTLGDPGELKVKPLKDLSSEIRYLLDIVIEKGASDLHLTVGYTPQIRVDGDLMNVGEILTPEDVKTLINQTLSPNQKELLEVNKEVDLSYAHGNKARFRVNAYNERGNLAAAYRLIPTKIRSLQELNLPSTLFDFTRIGQGLFLVTGPTGSGKSTTLAGMLQEINLNYPLHIITIEDPIEYVYPKGRALVDQRELGQDTHDWGIALRSILRQDPDVVLIGEMRDFETIQSAITTAETGHLVFATLHTNSAAQSIDRIIDVFPPHQQSQIRTQLAGSLKGILSQRLIPKIGGGREAAVELMIVTPAIQNLIREGKTFQIDNIISTSFDMGMIQLERSLVKMVREGKISVETAQEYAIRPDEIIKLMKSGI